MFMHTIVPAIFFVTLTGWAFLRLKNQNGPRIENTASLIVGLVGVGVSCL